MRQHKTRVEPSFGKKCFEMRHLTVAEWFADPATLVAGKKGKSRCSDSLGIQNGVPHTARRTDMSSDIFSHNIINRIEFVLQKYIILPKQKEKILFHSENNCQQHVIILPHLRSMG